MPDNPPISRRRSGSDINTVLTRTRYFTAFARCDLRHIFAMTQETNSLRKLPKAAAAAALVQQYGDDAEVVATRGPLNLLPPVT